jgi:hypothetical protein
LELTTSGKALIITLLFRLLFGGYIAGMDQYGFNDFESALTVLLIYGLLGIFAASFLLGNKKSGLLGIIGLDAVFITLQVVFIAASLSKNIDTGLHDPVSNWWATMLMVLFSLLTLVIATRTYREKTFLKETQMTSSDPKN